MPKAPHSLFARIYDLFMVPQDRLGLHRQRKRLCEDATGRVLEVAVGTGLNLSHYRSASEVVGIDIQRSMLRRAIRRTWESKVPVELVAADATNLPFHDHSFDTIVVAFSLCTIPDPDSTLEEFARVISLGGQMRFLEHVQSKGPRWSRVQHRIAPAWKKVSGGCRITQDTAELIRQSTWTLGDMWTSDTGGLIQGTATRS